MVTSRILKRTSPVLHKSHVDQLFSENKTKARDDEPQPNE